MACCPGSAMRLLLGLHARRPLPATALAESLLLHLDVCGGDPCQLEGRGGAAPLPSARPGQGGAASEQKGGAEGAWERGGCAAASWGALAELLQGCAARALARVEGAAAAAGSAAAAGGAAASADDEHARESEDSPTPEQPVASSAALDEWYALEEVLGSRAWWWGRCVLGPGMAATVFTSCGAGQLAAMAVAAAFALGSTSGFCREARGALAGAPARALVEALNVRRRLTIALGREPSPPRTPERTGVGAARSDAQQVTDVSGDALQGQAEAGVASAGAVGAGLGSSPEMASEIIAAASEGRKGKRAGPAASKARAIAAAKTAREGTAMKSPGVVQHRRRKRASGVTRAAL